MSEIQQDTVHDPIKSLPAEIQEGNAEDAMEGSDSPDILDATVTESAVPEPPTPAEQSSSPLSSPFLSKPPSIDLSPGTGITTPENEPMSPSKLGTQSVADGSRVDPVSPSDIQVPMSVDKTANITIDEPANFQKHSAESGLLDPCSALQEIVDEAENLAANKICETEKHSKQNPAIPETKEVIDEEDGQNLKNGQETGQEAQKHEDSVHPEDAKEQQESNNAEEVTNPTEEAKTKDEEGEENDKDDKDDWDDMEDEYWLSDTSPSRLEWERQKRDEDARNKQLGQMMRMIGLEEVKAHFLTMKARVEIAKRQKVDLSKERFNTVLLGNPGTGKTTVARIYAEYLSSIGAVPGTGFEETTARYLTAHDLITLKHYISNITSSGGGAFFIDEAYQLTSNKEVLDYLLSEIERTVGTVVYIFAGHPKKMEKLLGYDPGLPSRIPLTIQFKDYRDDEFLRMLVGMIRRKWKKNMMVEGGLDGLYPRIVTRRLGRGRGTPGFGNCRSLENLFSKMCQRQADRIQSLRKEGKEPDDFLLTKEDMIGPAPMDALKDSAAWKEVNELIGLEEVKKSIKAMMDRVQVNYLRELQEKEPIQVSLNRVFLGPPGTGKTTVGKLYGQILADMGLLSSGEVMIRNPTDLIGPYIGYSEKYTKRVLTAAMGKVLIIDEVYMLYPGSRSGGCNKSDIFRTAVIDTIVAEVQNIPGEDRCIILLGYTEPMVEMFQHANPGLLRRFPLEEAFHFHNFDDDQLSRIMDLKLEKQNLDATSNAKAIALGILSRAGQRLHFGNGGEVENLLCRAKASHQQRMSSIPILQRPEDILFEPYDFDAEFDRTWHASDNFRGMFADMVGCEKTIEQLEGYQLVAMGMKSRGIDPKPYVPFNFVFKGPPGTGKTTTARKMGQIFYDLGFLNSPDVFECSVSDMVGKYIGHTGPKVINLLESALGKVLLIDEAYRLGEGSFAREAISELVDCVTKPRFMHKVVIILAGYENDMNRLMSVNQGLSSRFPTEVVFHSMKPLQCLQLLWNELQKLQIEIVGGRLSTSPYRKRVLSLFEELGTLPTWGNGRDIQSLAKTIVGVVFRKCATDPVAPLSISAQELAGLLADLLREKKQRSSTAVTQVGYDWNADLFDG